MMDAEAVAFPPLPPLADQSSLPVLQVQLDPATERPAWRFER